MGKSFYKQIMSLIYPCRCAFCKKVISCGDFVCDICQTKMQPRGVVKPIFESGENEVAFCVSRFKYEGAIRKAILSFKFNNHKNYCEFFARAILDELTKNYDVSIFDYVTCVPLSHKRQKERGYNQSECIAKSISSEIKVDYKSLLVKIKDNLPQRGLTQKEREENTKGVYVAVNAECIKGKKILICDDIVTTGNTLKECVATLYSRGANLVVCCTVAYVNRIDLFNK